MKIIFVLPQHNLNSMINFNPFQKIFLFHLKYIMTYYIDIKISLIQWNFIFMDYLFQKCCRDSLLSSSFLCFLLNFFIPSCRWYLDIFSYKYLHLGLKEQQWLHSQGVIFSGCHGSPQTNFLTTAYNSTRHLEQDCKCYISVTYFKTGVA